MTMTVTPAACSPATVMPATPARPAPVGSAACDGLVAQPSGSVFTSTVSLSNAARNVVVSGNHNTTIVNNIDIDVIQLPPRSRAYYLPVTRWGRPLNFRPLPVPGWKIGRTFMPVMPWAR